MDDPTRLTDAPPAATVEALAKAAREDTRPTLIEPPPVRLTAVADVSLPTVAGLEAQLDAFYVGLLRFARATTSTTDKTAPIYLAENRAILFHFVEQFPERDAVRPIGIQSPFYDEIIEQLELDGVDYELARGLVAGTDAILLRDPAGNWVAIGPWHEVR